uniref:Uncharacterized protein AlNc14C236G9399 n=1 Tax=Albugo laibachii Nc14 TaxID=890382 RepID=F0W8C1_9STRA|nr:conserved hypothetical protein [Albugo laibachii Nc14]CCA24381.1 conserved hypothetical protein [Albugo laibachii Nc14]|eukprot:CCA24381.1 conserved hypothetical protein [Albugo laibachii Nc14]
MRLAFLTAASGLQTITYGLYLPTPPQIQCAPHYFTDDVDSIEFLNKIINMSQPHTEALLAQMDPLNLGNQRLAPFNYALLGSELLVTAFLSNVTVVGLSSGTLAPIGVQDAFRLKVNASFSKPVSVTGTALINVTTLERKRFHPCLLSVMHPFKCPPKILEFDFDIQVANITIGTLLYAEWFKCPAYTGNTCTDLSLSDFMGLISPGALPIIMDRVKNRMAQANMSELNVNFERLDNLTYSAHEPSGMAGFFLTKTLKLLQNRLNGKKKVYLKAKSMIDDGGMQAANAYIEGMSSEFGHTCVDTKPAIAI